MAALGSILIAATAVIGSVSASVGGYSLIATAVNNDNIWNKLPIQAQDAIRQAGLAVGR